jgi:hypothetical protein
MHTSPRWFAAATVAVAFALLPAGPARASDGGSDAARDAKTEAAAEAATDGALDTSSSGVDASCIPKGQACFSAEGCCDGLNCAAYGADGSLACGSSGASCLALGNPCTTADSCCDGMYCGEFGGEGHFTCGRQASTDKIPTSGCSLGAGKALGAGGAGLLGLLVGMFVVAGRRSRQRAMTPKRTL